MMTEQQAMLQEMGLSNLADPPRMVAEELPGTQEEWGDFLGSVPGQFLVQYVADTVEAIYHTLGVSPDMYTVHQAQGGLAVVQALQELLTEASTQAKEKDNGRTE